MAVWAQEGINGRKVQKITQQRASYSDPRAKDYSGKEIMNKEAGCICAVFGGRGEAHTMFWSRNIRKRDHLEDLG
jgi:hypothetical protein